MSQPTFFVPIAFARLNAPFREQDPQSRSDTPTGGAVQGGTAGDTPSGTPGAAGTQTPGAPKQQQGQPAQDPCGGPMMYMMPVFLVLMWLFMIRPEQKRRKEQQSLLASIKQGDRVVTLSGMHGVVNRLTDKTVTLRIDTIEITFDRSAVSRIERDDAPPAAN